MDNASLRLECLKIAAQELHAAMLQGATYDAKNLVKRAAELAHFVIEGK